MSVTVGLSPSGIAAFNVGRYISRIRSDMKREYAYAYHHWILKGRKGKEPNSCDLSYMAKQAVRMRIESFYREVNG